MRQTSFGVMSFDVHFDCRKSRVAESAVQYRTALMSLSGQTMSFVLCLSLSSYDHVCFGIGLSRIWCLANAARQLIARIGNGSRFVPGWFGAISGVSPCPAFGT